MNIKDDLNELRADILRVDNRVTATHKHDFFEQVAAPGVATGAAADTGEMHANITLAHRHLEDARMRLGKAIQAFDGGVSKYDAAPSRAPAAVAARITAELHECGKLRFDTDGLESQKAELESITQAIRFIVAAEEAAS